MATYTSSQSGDFSSSATWGGAGVPGDADAFNVSVGHTVTIDSGITVPTNGYADSYVYGILQSESGTSNTLRMDGRLYIKGGGLLHLRAGATIEITGSSPDQHGIWQENESGASVIMEGSDGMPSTTLSSAVSQGSTSLPVTSASNFAVGEWIAVFDNITSRGNVDAFAEAWKDEGFWIHDIDGNTIYFRTFVGPEEQITSVRGKKISVTNPKVYRVNQKIIFGTGSNRNVKTISSINYKNNLITLDSNVSGSVIGETVYLTGTDKSHIVNEKVRKFATVATAESSNTSNTVTVADASYFQTGDDIYIERVSEADGSTDYAGWWSTGNYKDMRHTISSISGNTITLTSAIDYTVKEKALVTRLTRDVILKCTTPGTDHGFFYSEHYSSNYAKKLILKDVYFKDFGNDDSNAYGGCTVRGYYSTDSLPVTLTETVPSYQRGAWMEGLVVHAYPDSTHQRDWGPIWMYDIRHTVLRCSMTMYGDDGITIYYEPWCGLFNCLTTGNDSFGYRIEGITGENEIAYCYSSRNNYGFRLYQPYEGDSNVWHDLIGDSLSYTLSIPGSDVNYPTAKYRMKFTGCRYLTTCESTSNGGPALLYSTIKGLSGIPNTQDETGTTQEGNTWTSGRRRYSSSRAVFKSIEHHFEYDRVQIFGYRTEAYWDVEEQAWRVFVRYDGGADPGMFESVFVPAGTTVRIKASVKMSPTFSGTTPGLTAFCATKSAYGNPNATGNFLEKGINEAIVYTNDSLTDYEEKTLTIQPVDYARTIVTGVYSRSNNAAEGYWIKDFAIYLDAAYPNPAFNILNNSGITLNNGVIAQVRNNFNQPKTRLGGRLR